MSDFRGTFTSKGQLVIPAELRRKHKIQPGTKVAIFEDELGRIVVQPITEEYIERLCGILKDGPDLLAIWMKEHREEDKGQETGTWTKPRRPHRTNGKRGS